MLLFCLFLVSCDDAVRHPQVGDWYESIETRKRFRVETVGTGKQVRAQYDSLLVLADSLAVELGYPTPAKDRFLLSMNDSDSSAGCIAYIEPVKNSDGAGVGAFYTVVPVEVLLTDYQHIPAVRDKP